jgi:hypothetical protein
VHASTGLPLIGVLINGWSSYSVGQLTTYAGIISDAALEAEHHSSEGGETYLFAEGTYLSSIEGSVHILQMTLADMKGLITPREHPEGNDAGTATMDSFPNAERIIMVGTVEFCQAAAHYLALRSGGVGSIWAFHFIRKLTRLHLNDAMWMWGEKDGVPNFSKVHMDELIHRASAA